MPFLDLGISILFVKAPEKSVNLFAFLLPLSRNVWLLMIFAGFAVSVVMYGIARYSPYETEELELVPNDEKNEKKEEPDTDSETPFASFHHCLWFTIASWVQQGCDFLPRLEFLFILFYKIACFYLQNT